MDYARKYRLVIATPNAPTRVWAATDDEYLQNIVNLVYDQVGKKNIKAFWLVGHSQGGMTSNRLVRTDFFKQRVDGWLSLSGGRLGPTPPIPASFFAAVQGTPGARDARAHQRTSERTTGGNTGRSARTAGRDVLLHLRNRRARTGRSADSRCVAVGHEARMQRARAAGRM